MKNILRRFLIVCWIGGLLSGVLFWRLNEVGQNNLEKATKAVEQGAAIEATAYYRETGRDEKKSAVYFMYSSLAILTASFLSQFIFLGVLNPLRLLKPNEDENVAKGKDQS